MRRHPSSSLSSACVPLRASLTALVGRSYTRSVVIELTIESIRVSLRNYQRVVILKEKDADRYLPIWIGPAEADAIAVRLQEVTVARPLTHDLLTNMIEQLGGAVRSVVVNDLANDTFFARIHIERDGSIIEVDSRPSDAIAVAVRTGVPIYVDERVLDLAGVQLNADGEPIDASGNAPSGISDEERQRLSAFSDFISGLDLDDLGETESGGRR
ncbi:MAG: bifunctional nuclease family protein [Chloroflexi bacterium]|nr:MAG: bifunctional nuclease family protein [Chloroflexota bacterium]